MDKEWVERGAALKALRYYYGCSVEVECDPDCTVTECAEGRIIMTLPAAEVVEVVHARWDEDRYPFCNVCPVFGLVIDRMCIKYNSGKLNYRPNCGAKMDGGKHETD
jgi:hypothetical protein